MPLAIPVPARPASALGSAEDLRQAGAEDRLAESLPRFFDGADPVRQDYGRFLTELGFRDYPAVIAENLAQGGHNELQKKVLAFNARRYRVINAARDLAADVMVGLSEQGYSQASLDGAAELAARLLSLQPLDPPASLPPEVARKDKAGIREWLITVTVQRLSAQLVQVVSDVVKTAVPARAVESGLQAVEDGRKEAPEARELLARIRRIKDSVERVLVTNYTDAEAGQTRYAGRALAASLVRLARRTGRPEVEADLERRLELRGLRLDNFIGDTVALPDRDQSGGITRLKLRTGDLLGERSGGREAAEITFGVRPARSLWFKAFREGLLGHPLGLWANPKARPKLARGQPARNILRQALYRFQSWLSGRRFMLNGYSHVGMASVEGSDGVSMAWAIDNYPNSGEGGIRKIGIAEEFAQPGPFLKMGVARMDADRVWDAFQVQARKDGYRDGVYKSGGALWPSLISRADYEQLLAIPRRESGRLLDELTRRAAGVLEEMMTGLGVGFASDFSNVMWRAYCSSTMMLAYRMGGQFEIQDKYDHWHPLVRLLKWLGVPGIKDQKLDGRIIWPGSLFIDPKVARHRTVAYPAYRAAGRIPSPYTMPAYVEIDRDLTRRLQSFAQLTDPGSITPDADIIAFMTNLFLDSDSKKIRSVQGSLSSGASVSRGYSAGLEALLEQSGGN